MVGVNVVIREFPELHDEVIRAMRDHVNDQDFRLSEIEFHISDNLSEKLRSEDRSRNARLDAMMRKALLERYKVIGQ